MLLFIGTLLSLALTAVLIFIGFVILIMPKKPDVKPGEDFRTQNEVKDFWHMLGFVDFTPNVIRAIVAGKEESGPIIDYIANVRGRIYDKKTRKMRQLETGEDPFAEENPIQKLLREKFGKVWIGIPYLRATKPIDIDRVVKKDTKDIGSNGSNQNKLSEQLSASRVKRYGLYGEIFRPTYHESIDTADGIRFNLISYAVLKINDPEPGFTIYNDNLLQTISSLISSFISSKVLKMEWKNYKEAGEGKEKFAEYYHELNESLKPLGVKVVHLMMSDPELHPDIQQAMEEKTKAEQTAAAQRLKGLGEKDYKISISEGEAVGIERIAKAKAQRFQELIALYTKNGVRPENAVEMANDLIAAEFNADAVGKLTTYVTGGGAGVQLAIPSGGEKKK